MFPPPDGEIQRQGFARGQIGQHLFAIGPPTASMPSRLAAFKKSCARYVVVVINNNRRGMSLYPPAGRGAAEAHCLPLGRLTIGITRGMVGGVRDQLDLRNFFADEGFNALTQRDVHHAASLAATTKANIDGVVFNVKQLDIPTMCRYAGIDAFVDQFLHP